MNTYSVISDGNFYTVRADVYETTLNLLEFFVKDGEGNITIVASFFKWEGVIKEAE